MATKKTSLFGGFKYLILALPLLFFAPIVITIGFKALKLDQKYLILIVGIIMGIAAMIVTAIGVLKIAKHLFDSDKDEA